MFDAHRLNCPSRKVVSTKKMSLGRAGSLMFLAYLSREESGPGGRSIGVIECWSVEVEHTHYSNTPLLQSASFQYPSLRSLSRMLVSMKSPGLILPAAGLAARSCFRNKSTPFSSGYKSRSS